MTASTATQLPLFVRGRVRDLQLCWDQLRGKFRATCNFMSTLLAAASRHLCFVGLGAACVLTAARAPAAVVDARAAVQTDKHSRGDCIPQQPGAPRAGVRSAPAAATGAAAAAAAVVLYERHDGMGVESTLAPLGLARAKASVLWVAA